MANKVDNQMTERNSRKQTFDLRNQNSSGIHGSSAIGYDSEDYYHPVNLQIETSDAGKADDTNARGTPGQVMQLFPE